MSPDHKVSMKPTEPDRADPGKKDEAAELADTDAFLPAPANEEQRKIVEEWERPPGQSSG